MNTPDSQMLSIVFRMTLDDVLTMLAAPQPDWLRAALHDRRIQLRDAGLIKWLHDRNARVQSER